MEGVPMPGGETVPYASAYGVANLAAQELLRNSAIVVLDEAFAAVSDWRTARELQQIADRRGAAYLQQLAERRISGTPSPAVAQHLPPVYAARYDSSEFLMKWSITLSTVGWKLAQARGLPLTNVAEELALYAIIQDAVVELDFSAAQDPEAALALDELLEDAFEDQDFLALFEVDRESELAALERNQQLGVADLRFENWFNPFGSGVDRGVPHPFVTE